ETPVDLLQRAAQVLPAGDGADDRTETFLGAEDVPGELGGAGRDGGVDRAEDAVDVVVDERGAGEVPHQTRDGLRAAADAGDEPVDTVEETHVRSRCVRSSRVGAGSGCGGRAAAPPGRSRAGRRGSQGRGASAPTAPRTGRVPAAWPAAPRDRGRGRPADRR